MRRAHTLDGSPSVAERGHRQAGRGEGGAAESGMAWQYHALHALVHPKSQAALLKIVHAWLPHAHRPYERKYEKAKGNWNQLEGWTVVWAAGKGFS